MIASTSLGVDVAAQHHRRTWSLNEQAQQLRSVELNSAMVVRLARIELAASCSAGKRSIR
jgi:hypothetical protein